MKQLSSVGDQTAGFTLTEIIVATLIMMIMLMVVLRSQLNSALRTEQSAELNQIQNSIRQDLNMLRQEADRWQCEQGTACTGKAVDLDTPMRYLTSHCDEPNPLDTFPLGSEALIDTTNKKLQRNIIINSKKIEVQYIGSSRGKTIKNNTILIPQAMHWCN